MDFLVDVGQRCDEFRLPRYLELVVSILILLGLLVSYLPQHYRIISRGTAEGIAPYYVLLGTMSATAGFANILTAGASRKAMSCCREVEGFECAASMLGIAQLGAQWLCFSLIMVLFLIFFRHEDAAVPQDELGGESPKWQTAATVGLVAFLHALITIIVTGVFAVVRPQHLTFLGNLWGVVAAALAAVQYVPQIWTTYHLKHAGSLSIPMMCMQTPGGFLFAASLYFRLGAEGWSTWAIYLLTAIMQGCVLVMCVYYEVMRRQRVEGEGPPLINEPSSPPEPYTPHNIQRPVASRTYSEGWERGLPGPFTGHPERYAETEEDLEHIQDREERAIARESQPLLKPGGIGNPNKNYKTNHL